MNLYRVNSASHEDIKRHLQACEFIPKITDYVEDIDLYIDKMTRFATRIECWDGDILTGLNAFYCNNFETKEAFITNVSVLPDYGGRGIATELISKSADYCNKKGFKKISLEVFSVNNKAIGFYKHLGFITVSDDKNKLKMTFNITDKK